LGGQKIERLVPVCDTHPAFKTACLRPLLYILPSSNACACECCHLHQNCNSSLPLHTSVIRWAYVLIETVVYPRWSGAWYALHKPMNIYRLTASVL